MRDQCFIVTMFAQTVMGITPSRSILNPNNVYSGCYTYHVMADLCPTPTMFTQAVVLITP